MDKDSDLLKGLFIGGLIGIALGLLFAPKSGKETREDITRRANKMLAKAKEEYEKAAGKSKLAYEASLKNLQNLNVSAKEKAGEIGNKVSEAVQQGAEAIQSNKSRLKRAIDAGMEAYREESGKEKA
ncbi:MAG: YtxH domain-containing protein [Deltaproteobacteria bacterium]|nr:YtxH domain-containing protein [Deltaproteobacteria bacterium]